MKDPIWKRHVDAIRNILVSEWDPIGCGWEDEYDVYIPKIYLLMQSPKTNVAKLADHLEKLETINMGLSANREKDRRVAEMLLRVMK